MISRFLTQTVSIAIAATLVLGGGRPGSAAYFPDEGDFYYNGFTFVDSYLRWTRVGPFSVSDPGYEHDFLAYSSYFTSCTTWNNLPAGYDDCVTAGASDSPPYYAFSFGTYHARQIQQNTIYYGAWQLAGGSGATFTSVRLNGQENRHTFCPFDNPWCMNGIRSEQLAWGHFVWGSCGRTTWDFFP